MTNPGPFIPPPFSPQALGLPEQAFRPLQWDPIARVLDSKVRVVGICMPPGSGKSCVSASIASLRRSSGRVAILVATKAHQDQMIAQYGPHLPIADIRGHNAYECKPRKQADGSWECSWPEGLCPYLKAKKLAEKSPILLTNYSMWVTDQVHGGGRLTAGVETIIGDEGTLALDLISSACTIELNVWNLGADYWARMGAGGLENVSQTLGALYALEPDVQDRERELEQQKEREQRQGGRSQALERELRRVRSIRSRIGWARSWGVNDDQWVMAKEQRNGEADSLKLVPISVAQVSRDYVIGGAERVVFMSATLVQKTLAQLGVEAGTYEFYSYPHPFPESQRPVYYLPTIRMNHRTTEEELNVLIGRLDNLLRTRQDRRGIIHSVSYDRMKVIASRSFYGGQMITHQQGRVAEAVEKFREAPSPCTLVSPAVSFGFDMGGGLCQYIIVLKVPWPDTRDVVTERRSKADPEYAGYEAMQLIVQGSGRGTRCFDRETEILTTTGWKRWNEVTPGDTAFGLKNTQARIYSAPVLEENPILSVQRNDEPEPMVHITAKSLDLMITPDHRVFIQKKKQSKYESLYTKNGKMAQTTQFYNLSSTKLSVGEASNLPARFRVPVAGRVDRGNGTVHSKDWFWLMGIIIADGSVEDTKGGIRIYQSESKPEVCEAIESTLSRLGLSYTLHTEHIAGTPMSVRGGAVYHRNGDKKVWIISGYSASRIRDIFVFGQRRRCSKKRLYRQASHRGVPGWHHIEKLIPTWCLSSASRQQLICLLGGLMAGDGSWKEGSNSGAYYTKDKALADQVQTVLSLIGYRSTLVGRRDQYEIRFSKYPFVDVVREASVSESDAAPSWCVKTHLGSVLIRRNGKTAICGNSSTDPTCEIIILDTTFGAWFWRKYYHLAPSWFQPKQVDNAPEPPVLHTPAGVLNHS